MEPMGRALGHWASKGITIIKPQNKDSRINSGSDGVFQEYKRSDR